MMRPNWLCFKRGATRTAPSSAMTREEKPFRRTQRLASAWDVVFEQYARKERRQWQLETPRLVFVKNVSAVDPYYLKGLAAANTEKAPTSPIRNAKIFSP